MPKPTIGRRVYFWPVGFDKQSFNLEDDKWPLDAGVVFVNSDGTVNLAVTDHQGRSQPVLRVPFVAEVDGVPPQGESYAEWMPYQKAAATSGAA